MENNTFRIGLCMAGAVSAGAYTAGVVDYLLEALEEWEKRRGQPGVPSHRVLIPVMGGASAGGMTAIVTASALSNTIKNVPVPDRANVLKPHPENKLYNTWVDLLDADMFPKMLSTSDIADGHMVSLLNSQFIDEIAKKIIQQNPADKRRIPPYFETPVKLFTTLSNLEGYDYNISFNAGARKQKYVMTLHNDYACFELYENGERKISKGWMALNFQTGENATLATDAAMATGAFPVGLKSRVMKRDAQVIRDNVWLESIFKNTPLTANEHTTLNVDGGLINNEPFERVRNVLDHITLDKGYITYNSVIEKEEKMAELNALYSNFVNTVLMVDPFPGKEKGKFEIKQDLFGVIGKTFNAMQNQMRIKPVDYKAAMDLTDASRFIISPSRFFRDAEGNTNEVFGESAIACGAMGGFSGFISKEFRVHDFYLGRFNCEIFLRDYLTIPADDLPLNPIFSNGYAGTEMQDFKSGYDNSYQIIPIFTPRRPKGEFPVPIFSSGSNWPIISEKTIDNFRPAIKDRVQVMLLKATGLTGLNKALIWAGAKVVLNRVLTNKALDAIKSSLREWKLLKKE